MNELKTYCLILSGFLQPKQLSNGCRDLWQSLPEYDDQSARYARWHVDIEVEAAMIAGFPPNCKIMLAGHSFGGSSCVYLARELDKLGRAVDCLFLCDAVSQFHMPPVLTVPSIVRQVWIWKQRHPLAAIHGSSVFCLGDVEVMKREILTDIRHNQMDSLPDFHAAVRDEWVQ